MMSNKIIHKKIYYQSPYFDKFKTIELNDFIEADKDLLILELNIYEKFILKVIYSYEQDSFCFESFFNNKRLQFIVLNKIEIDEIYYEYDLFKPIHNILSFINDNKKINYSFIDVLEDKEIMELIKIYLFETLDGIYNLDCYIVNDSYICFYKEININKNIFIITNLSRINSKFFTKYEHIFISKEDRDIMNYMHKLSNKINRKISKDIQYLILYLL